jgi:hypothetical protein
MTPSSRAHRAVSATVRPDRSRTSRLLLAEGLSPQEASSLLAPYGFADPQRADANIQQMAGEPRSRALLADLLDDLLEMVAETAEPDQALTHWERYAEATGNRIPLFDYLRGSPRMLHLLCSIFGNSVYLSQTLIRDPLLVYWLAEEQVLRRCPSAQTLARTLDDMLDHVNAKELKLDALRRFKRREMLRIGVRDLLRLASVPETVRVLSDLATVLIRAALKVVDQDLGLKYGRPMHRDSRGKLIETGFAVIALGGIVRSRNIKVAGDKLNDDIISYIRNEFKILIGERTAESIKVSIGAVLPDEAPIETSLRGRDLVTGLPREMIITDADIREAISASIESLVEAVREVLETTPPEVLSDVMARGIVLDGGGALISGLPQLLQEELKLPIHVVSDPLTAVVRGTGVVLEDIEAYQELLLDDYHDLAPTQ